MKCWNCEDIDLIWGGDHEQINEDGESNTVSNFSCPNCDALVFFYHGTRDTFTPEWAREIVANEPELH